MPNEAMLTDRAQSKKMTIRKVAKNKFPRKEDTMKIFSFQTRNYLMLTGFITVKTVEYGR